MSRRRPGVFGIAAPRRSGAPRAAFVFTCEHGGNRIPARYRSFFAGCDAQLRSHRGFDEGALALAQEFAAAFAAPLIATMTSRLLVDTNRSPQHRSLHADALKKAPPEVLEKIRQEHYLPYRQAVSDAIDRALAKGATVVHISVHSFAPKLHGVTREADVGLLYDPHRERELAVAKRWQAALTRALPGLIIRRNYPYQGRADGFTTALRRRYRDAEYAGIELEVNQKHLVPSPRPAGEFRRKLILTSKETLK